MGTSKRFPAVLSAPTGLWYDGVGSISVCTLCTGARTKAPITRDFLFRKIVFPSNVLERSEGRGKIIGALDVEAGMSALARGRE
jgi:hypothetical protein